MLYENRFITDFKEKAELLIFVVFFINNAPFFLIIAISLLLILIILLTNAYLQLQLQPMILEKLFKILIQTKPMDMIT